MAEKARHRRTELEKVQDELTRLTKQFDRAQKAHAEAEAKYVATREALAEATESLGFWKNHPLLRSEKD